MESTPKYCVREASRREVFTQPQRQAYRAQHFWLEPPNFDCQGTNLFMPFALFTRTEAGVYLFRLQVRVWKAIRAKDMARAMRLQKLILRSRSARLLAIRQVTQLNQGKRTAGVDGKASLSFKERFELDELLKTRVHQWEHLGLREIPIPKKDGTTRTLKVPTISDRAWQCLAKYAIEPAHEALFNARSYGFRPGRSAHDAQKILFTNLRSYSPST